MTNSRIACGLWKGCQTGGGLHDPRCPASGQTTPASPEPTKGDRDLARAVAAEPPWTEPSREYWSDRIAEALASQRAEIVARYGALAAEWSHTADLVNPDGPMADVVYSSTLNDCARDIRQVAPK